jgi:hypothetical protein
LLRRKKIALISVLIAYAIVVPVFAYMYFYTTNPQYFASGVIVQNYTQPTLGLGIYWDQNCTQPITRIDFGNLTYTNYQQELWSHVFYLRNEGNVPLTLNWNSTLQNVSTQIGEWCTWWGPPPVWGSAYLNNKVVDNGTVLTAWYGIRVPSYPTAGTYNWTLGIWGTYSY